MNARLELVLGGLLIGLGVGIWIGIALIAGEDNGMSVGWHAWALVSVNVCKWRVCAGSIHRCHGGERESIVGIRGAAGKDEEFYGLTASTVLGCCLLTAILLA